MYILLFLLASLLYSDNLQSENFLSIEKINKKEFFLVLIHREN